MKRIRTKRQDAVPAQPVIADLFLAGDGGSAIGHPQAKGKIEGFVRKIEQSGLTGMPGGTCSSKAELGNDEANEEGSR